MLLQLTDTNSDEDNKEKEQAAVAATTETTTTTGKIAVVAKIEQDRSRPPIRRGAKYIVDDYEFKVDQINTPLQLQQMLINTRRQRVGSKRFEASYGHWCHEVVASLRYHLWLHLPVRPNTETYGALYYELGQAADQGTIRPQSFTDAGARSGYAVEFFCRARLLMDLLLDKYLTVRMQKQKKQQHTDVCAVSIEGGKNENESHNSEECQIPDIYATKFCNYYDYSSSNSNATESNEESFVTTTTMKVLSLGGGPGYDFIGILLADQIGTAGYSTTRIEALVFDYQEGWANLVHAMNTSTQTALINTQQSCVTWGGGCDITLPLTHASNAACLDALSTSDVIVCQYCVAENANRLRASDFCFFRDVFDQAALGTVIIISEVTPRLWPELVDLLYQRQQEQHLLLQPDREHDIGFDVDFVRAKKRYIAPQLMIQKRRGGRIRPLDLVACQEFSHLKELHQRKMKSGFQRQSKKVKGVK